MSNTRILRAVKIATDVLNGNNYSKVGRKHTLSQSRVGEIVAYAFQLAVQPQFEPNIYFNHRDSIDHKRKDKMYWLMQLEKVKEYANEQIKQAQVSQV